MSTSFPRSALIVVVTAIILPAEAASSTNSLPEIAASGSSAAAAVFRMLGALCLVLALFFGGAWVFRNWARLDPRRGGPQRKLHVLEARSLGARQSLVVVAYDKQRFLVGSTPQGLTLLSALPDTEEVAGETPAFVPLPFPDALMQALGRK